jgi:hypothetical protein
MVELLPICKFLYEKNFTGVCIKDSLPSVNPNNRKNNFFIQKNGKILYVKLKRNMNTKRDWVTALLFSIIIPLIIFLIYPEFEIYIHSQGI